VTHTGGEAGEIALEILHSCFRPTPSAAAASPFGVKASTSVPGPIQLQDLEPIAASRPP
jgi:hypothetical protein